MTALIGPTELFELRQVGTGVDLIDVRTPSEYREAHVEFARNVPLDRLDASAIAAARNSRTGEPLYVICQSGSRGKRACDKLVATGLEAVNVEGGTLAWISAGLPVVRGKKTISLERQVRIAIGIIVLVSAALAIFVHPYWIGLAAFMGGGLIFSGVADFCGLALLLARLPWNQTSADSIGTGNDDAGACCSVPKTQACRAAASGSGA
jgi:rhodanese-related sulfurtransferase